MAFSPTFWLLGDFVRHVRYPCTPPCHRKAAVIKYLESGDPEIAGLLINANTSFVCSLSASLGAEMNF